MYGVIWKKNAYKETIAMTIGTFFILTLFIIVVKPLLKRTQLYCQTERGSSNYHSILFLKGYFRRTSDIENCDDERLLSFRLETT